MRSSTAVAVAVLIVLILSGLGLAAPHARAASQPTPFSHARPLSTVSINPSTAYGGYATTFCTGYTNQFCPSFAAGKVFFVAYDPSDTSATVAINDPNATRDGLSAVQVMSWTVHFPTGPYNYSYNWASGGGYLLPFSLVDEGWWNLTINGATGGFFSVSFFVHTYLVRMGSDQPAYLAGHSGTMTFAVNSTVNNAPFSSVTSLKAIGVYETVGFNFTAIPNLPSSLTAPNGQFPFTVPSNANTYSGMGFEIWANITTASGNSSESWFDYVPVGYISNPSVGLGSCPTGCGTNTFAAGGLVYTSVSVDIISPGGDFPAPGLTVNFGWLSGTTPVTSVPGNPPTSLATNATGRAAMLFIADATAFSTTGPNTLAVTVTDPVLTSAAKTSANATFFVLPAASAIAHLELMLDGSQYFGGDTATATWAVGGVGSSGPTGWTVDSWTAYESVSNTLTASGTIASSADQGTFTLTAPMGYAGNLEVMVTAHNATAWISAFTNARVSQPSILLSPSERYYLPGDSISVSVATLGTAFSSATLWMSVLDSSGNALTEGQLTGTQIQFTIPKIAAPGDVSVTVVAQTSTGGLVGQAQVTLYLASGIQVLAGVSTASNYVDGSYQPGQTVQISFAISAIGNTVLPKSYTIVVLPEDSYYAAGAGSSQFQTSSTSGSVAYTIPSGSPGGAQLIYVEVQCNGVECGSWTYFSLNVNPHPSVLGMQLGAGSGFTVSWLILLIIVVVLFILGFRRGRGGGRPMVMHPMTEVSSSGASSGPGDSGGAAGSSGTPSWNEAGGSGSSNSPPLPTPPK
ncbi:MAG: hypothetical protein ACHQ2Y_09995 [Candidatus Lutacidiplasmatales archaeon]